MGQKLYRKRMLILNMLRLRKGKIPKRVYFVLKANPYKRYNAKLLSKEIGASYTTVRRALSRLAGRGHILSDGEGGYFFLPPSDLNFINPVETFKLATDILKRFGLRDIPEDRKFLAEILQKAVSTLMYKQKDEKHARKVTNQ